jgi:hypothetical protein
MDITILESKLKELKDQFIVTDVFGDNYDELLPLYTELVNSVKQANNNTDKIRNLKLIKKQFYANDLLYSDEAEIRESGIFIMIDNIVEYINSCSQ